MKDDARQRCEGDRQVGTGMVPTEQLILGELPWTKPEVRAVTIAQLDLYPGLRVLEIGAGTGTVTVEIARRLGPGQVVAVEQKAAGCELVQANLDQWGLTNVQVIQGKAPLGLPEGNWDRIFIGGSGGNLPELLEYALEHLRTDGVLVMNTVTLDSLTTAERFLRERGLSCETVLLQVSRIKQVGSYSMYQGENPIHILKVQPAS